MYGQQFSNPIASAAKWMFFGFFGVILMAALLGANVKDAKWLNSDIAEAEAQRIQIEAAHQQATYELQEQLAQAQTVAEIQAIQREQIETGLLAQEDVAVFDTLSGSLRASYSDGWIKLDFPSRPALPLLLVR